MAGPPSDLPGSPPINRTTPSGPGIPTMRPMTFSARPGPDWLAMTARHYGVWWDAGGEVYPERLGGVPPGCWAVAKEQHPRGDSKGS
jgi:hypothetical protein